ncbi:unnamed protein product, partial [Tenebrio molitor]
VKNTSEDVLDDTPLENQEKLSSTNIDKIEGRRIVDIQFFVQQILSFPHHGLFSCTGDSVI